MMTILFFQLIFELRDNVLPGVNLLHCVVAFVRILAQFCSCNVGTRSELTQDAFEFCQVMGRMAPDNDGIVHFCRRTSRTTQEEMEQCVDTSIANRKNDTLIALFMWPLHNAIAIL